MIYLKPVKYIYENLNFCNEQITICAHDAGAANHTFHIFKKNIKNSKLCLAGPAYEIFNKSFKDIKNLTINNSLLGSKYLISGTGWETDFEHEARKIAAKRGIYSIAILDHWVNYYERFQRDNETVLPNEIWVTDEVALKIAKNIFHKIPIIKIPNFSFEEIIKKVKIEKSSNYSNSKNHLPKRLLYLTEPIRTNWNRNEPGEFQALKYFFASLEKLSKNYLISSKNEIEKIIIKLHPSEKLNKYDSTIKSIKSNIPISIIKSDRLHEYLAWSEATFGCETQALVISLGCKIPTFSTIPPWGDRCRLPHSNIINVLDI